MCDENLAEKFLCKGADFFGALCKLHTAGFAASARMDLRLDDNDRSIEFFGIGDGLMDAECGQPVRYVDAELTQYLLGLVLMNEQNSGIAAILRFFLRNV